MTQPDNLRDPFAPPAPGSTVPGPAVPAQPPAGGWAPVATTHVVPHAALATPWMRLGAALLNAVLVVVTLGIGYLVWTLVLWSEGTNPGKKICGLRVVKADTGRTCTFGDMLVRGLVMGWLVLGIIGTVTLGLAYLVDALMIFGDRRQRLVDRVSGTLVVQV